jgi:hypothetical protein
MVNKMVQVLMLRFTLHYTLPKMYQTRQCFDDNFLSIKAQKRVFFTKPYKAAPGDTNPIFMPIRKFFKHQPLVHKLPFLVFLLHFLCY